MTIFLQISKQLFVFIVIISGPKFAFLVVLNIAHWNSHKFLAWFSKNVQKIIFNGTWINIQKLKVSGPLLHVSEVNHWWHMSKHAGALENGEGESYLGWFQSKLLILLLLWVTCVTDHLETSLEGISSMTTCENSALMETQALCFSISHFYHVCYPFLKLSSSQMQWNTFPFLEPYTWAQSLCLVFDVSKRSFVTVSV